MTSTPTSPVSPAVIERAVLRYLRNVNDWCEYHQMIYRVAKELRPKSYTKDGTKTAVFKCCGDLLKNQVIFRRKWRIGGKSCWRKQDRRPDQVRLNEVYSPSSISHGRLLEVFESQVAGRYHGPTGFVAKVRSGDLVPDAA